MACISILVRGSGTVSLGEPIFIRKIVGFSWVTPEGTVTDLVEPEYTLLDPYELGGIPVSHGTVKSPFQDGRTYLNSLLDEKGLSLQFFYKANSELELLTKRREIMNLFNPKRGEGYLVWTQADGVSFHIKCISDGTPEFEMLSRRAMTFRLSFVAYDPYYYSHNINRATLAATQTTKFPLTFPFSLGQNDDTVVADNLGGSPAPVTITITGKINTPRITNNETTEYIEVNLNMTDAEDVFVITTGFGNKKALWTPKSTGVTVNGFGYITPASKFFQLLPGENELTLTNVSIEPETLVTVEWRDRYVGV